MRKYLKIYTGERHDYPGKYSNSRLHLRMCGMTFKSADNGPENPGTAVCKVLATSANRAPCACATMAVNFGRRYLNRGYVLGLDSPDLTLTVVCARRTRCIKPSKPCFAVLS